MKHFVAVDNYSKVSDLYINLDYVTSIEHRINDNEDGGVLVYVVGCEYPFTIDEKNWGTLTERLCECN